GAKSERRFRFSGGMLIRMVSANRTMPELLWAIMTFSSLLERLDRQPLSMNASLLSPTRPTCESFESHGSLTPLTVPSPHGMIPSLQSGSSRKGGPVPRENYAATVTAWRQFLDSVDEEIAQLPYVKRLVVQLEAMYGRAQELIQKRAALQAAKQAATRELQELLPNGRVAINCVRKTLRLEFGKTSERLVQYGIKPYRGRARRKKDQEPKEKA
ncbi:MAG TPA: hypothetical protein VE078_19105, partial [Thermoanaerobaculia bacterium]|nr:hypothetical protein [Thermoanaerobaculia bacterium]